MVGKADGLTVGKSEGTGLEGNGVASGGADCTGISAIAKGDKTGESTKKNGEIEGRFVEKGIGSFEQSAELSRLMLTTA